jgi:sulfur carrier protein
VKAFVNGKRRDLPENMTLADLLEELRAPERGVAVAKNDRVVRRSRLALERVGEGDRIEIITAAAGG